MLRLYARYSLIMRPLIAVLILSVFACAAIAQDDPPKPVAITLEPLGDTDHGVAARVFFQFANPHEVTEAGLFIQGSFIQDGQVTKNFRFAVPREEDRLIGNTNIFGRRQRWSLLPDKRNQMTAIHTFSVGEAEIEARLLLETDDGRGPLLIAKTSETFTIAKTNQPYVANVDDGAEAIVAEGVVPENVGAVRIRPPQRDVAPNLFVVDVETAPSVTRVEFWVEGKKILARNKPPFSAELDLGKLPKRVEVRAVGYDAQGRYVDADAFIVNERETPLEAKITRVQTPDGVSHFKISVQNFKGTNLKSIVLYAGDRKLQEWTRPPYAISIPTASLAGVEFVRASVIDATGYEASDLMFLDGDRYIEEIEVSLVELPVTVTDRMGVSVSNLAQKNFTVLENGKPQTLTSFNFAANLPISVGVLLDQSTSMEDRLDTAKSAAIGFFKNILKKNDRAFISTFASDPTRSAVFVSDISTLEMQVNAIGKAEGSTALYDAIVTGLYRFRNIQGRKALVVITDGDDTSSRLSYVEMMEYMRSARVPVYFIGIGFSVLDVAGPGRMRAMAAETGGAAYFIRNVKQLGETYKQLEDDLRSQYLLSYHAETSKKDQAYRTIEVKVDQPDAKVRTIHGYIP